MAQCRRIIFNNVTMSPRSLFNEGFTPLESPAACSGDEDIIPSGPEAFRARGLLERTWGLHGNLRNWRKLIFRDVRNVMVRLP